VDPLPAPLRVSSGGLVTLPLLERGLAPEPAIVLQAIGVQPCTATASSTAHPGSASCARNRRKPAVASQRGDVVERGVDGGLVDPWLELALPGVSISNAPPGSSTSCRAVVVCRPLRQRR